MSSSNPDPTSSTSPLGGNALPPPPPVDKFFEVQKLIDANKTGDGAVISKALAILTEPERIQFSTWYRELATFRLGLQESKDTAHKPLDASSFVSVLGAVNWADENNIENFVSSTYGGGSRAAGERIYLGMDNSIRYYFNPTLPRLRMETNNRDIKDPHGYIVQLRNVDGSLPPFQYGFPLGSVSYEFDDSTVVGDDQTSDVFSTPFLVVLNVVQRSVWIILDSIYKDEMGEDFEIPFRSNGWDYLPSPQNNRKPFTSFLLQKLQGLSDVTDAHSFFEGVLGADMSGAHIRFCTASSSDFERVSKQGG